MDRCATLLKIETQEYNRAFASPSAAATTSAIASLSEAQRNGAHNAQAQELYGAMVQLADHLQRVTHDLLHHQQRHRHLAKATTSSASLAPTKKKTIVKKKKSVARARRCDHCGKTSSPAWRRGPNSSYVHTTNFFYFFVQAQRSDHISQAVQWLWAALPGESEGDPLHDRAFHAQLSIACLDRDDDDDAHKGPQEGSSSRKGKVVPLRFWCIYGEKLKK
jgi:hypothetical protein